MSILDVNSLIEDVISTKILGKSSSDYYGVGLWLLSFINHSCNPNTKRFNIGDYVIVHASRDVKAGEELTFAYFDVFSLLSNRKKMASSWGFDCNCKRCKFEGLYSKQEMRETELGIERGLDLGGVIYKLEDCMRRWMVRGKAKGYLTASFWGAYAEVFGSEKLMRKWGRQIPAMETLVARVVDGIGSDERILKVYREGIKRNGGGYSGSGSGVVVEMEKAMKLGRGVYGKVMKKQAMKSILEDMKNAMSLAPQNQRSSYVKTANELVDNMSEFDYFVRTPKIYELYLYYEKTLKSIDELVALLA